jgi:hypothetical protein
MYVRFVIQGTDRNSNQRQGFFQAMAELKAKRELYDHEETLYREIYKCFKLTFDDRGASLALQRHTQRG